MPAAQGYPGQGYPYPPMMSYPNHPMVQPATYPTGYNPTMMSMPYGAGYGAGYGGTSYGPAPAYWNPNYRGY